MWWILPAAIVGLVVVLWLLLSGLPFGRDEKTPKPARVETIAEGTSTRETGTLVDVPAERDDASEPVAPSPAPRASVNVDARTPATRPPVREVPSPAPGASVDVDSRTPATRPPAREVPLPAPRASSEITAAEAEAALRNYVISTNFYRLGSDCIRLQNRGYSNVGYAFEVWSSCGEGGASRQLGRWRVDAKTREVFRQRDDGRYLRP